VSTVVGLIITAVAVAVAAILARVFYKRKQRKGLSYFVVHSFKSPRLPVISWYSLFIKPIADTQMKPIPFNDVKINARLCGPDCTRN